ncbi:hypothetical protein BBJ28_00000286 [Nothophytophthora sp. Chile5]|nr:hypothetical protein BBJ28_00000286 [Nothophytophthora sp. Chile5]
MGISRDSRHKRRETGGKRKQFRKKRKFELGRQPGNTKLGGKRVHAVRVRGGHMKFRALHLETGNFSWGTEVSARKTRILDVVYNASNNELVRTKTLVKGAVVLVDATPFRQWYEAHYGVKIGVKKNAEKVEEEEVKKSDHVLRKLASRQRTRELDVKIDEQFMSGRLLAVISSRPGQSGRADGYLLEGKELEFYQRKLATKKSKKAVIVRAAPGPQLNGVYGEVVDASFVRSNRTEGRMLERQTSSGGGNPAKQATLEYFLSLP